MSEEHIETIIWGKQSSISYFQGPLIPQFVTAVQQLYNKMQRFSNFRERVIQLFCHIQLRSNNEYLQCEINKNQSFEKLSIYTKKLQQQYMDQKENLKKKKKENKNLRYKLNKSNKNHENMVANLNEKINDIKQKNKLQIERLKKEIEKYTKKYKKQKNNKKKVLQQYENLKNTYQIQKINSQLMTRLAKLDQMKINEKVDQLKKNEQSFKVKMKLKRIVYQKQQTQRIYDGEK